MVVCSSDDTDVKKLRCRTNVAVAQHRFESGHKVRVA
jgi:hypothetical protein